MPNRAQLEPHPLKKAAGNTLWTLISRVALMFAKFFTVPILLRHYGKADYGLIALVASLNGYMAIANLALPTGMIKHTAAWLGTGKLDKLSKASRSSVVFYGCIGLMNFSLFLLLAKFGLHFFNVPADKVHNLQLVLFVAGVVTLFSWPFSVVDQLLSGAEELAWVAKINVSQEVIGLFVVVLAVWLDLSIALYFFLFLLTSLILIPLKLQKWSCYIPLSQSLKPGWYWEEFKEVLSFGLGLFVIGVSMSSATYLRPVILAARATEGVSSVAEYQILFGITSIVLVFQGVISSSLLPLASKAFATNDNNTSEAIIYKVTKYVWSFLALIIFLIMMLSDRLLTVYVGQQYESLAVWLCIWLFSFLFLYLGPITSVVMGTGNIKLLVFSSPTSAIVSLVLAWLLAPNLNVGAVAISTLCYFAMQFAVYHVYYLPRVLDISPLHMLYRYFSPPIIAGVPMVFVGRSTATLITDNPYLWLMIASLSGGAAYVLCLNLISIKINELLSILKALTAKEI